MTELLFPVTVRKHEQNPMLAIVQCDSSYDKLKEECLVRWDINVPEIYCHTPVGLLFSVNKTLTYFSLTLIDSCYLNLVAASMIFIPDIISRNFTITYGFQ